MARQIIKVLERVATVSRRGISTGLVLRDVKVARAQVPHYVSAQFAASSHTKLLPPVDEVQKRAAELEELLAKSGDKQSIELLMFENH